MERVRDQTREGQPEYWERWHTTHDTFDLDIVHKETLELFADSLGKPPAKVVELGCGQGYDAVELASRGFLLTAVDLSAVALRKVRDLANRKSVTLTIKAVDLSNPPYPWPDSTFDGIYSYLSLHYFDDAMTARIFSEIRRLISPRGVFVFTVRSIKDPLFGRGLNIGPNLYRSNDHVRHFFTIPYLMTLLANWHIEQIDELTGHYTNPSYNDSLIRVVAHAK
jgi:SAM-dependent methyltransferase